MSWQYPEWTPQLASKRGFAVWDLFYTKWGNISAGIGNGVFPDARDGNVKLPNFHGIAIGSRSTVERVAIQTKLVADTQAQPGLIPLWVDGRRIIDFQMCHIGMPLRGQVLGPVTVYNDEPYTSATEYIPDDGVNTPALLVSSKLEEPALHLVLLQRKQDVSLLNGPRMPMFRQQGFIGQAAGAEVLAKIYPIAGRRTIVFQGSPANVTWRLGVMGARQQSTDPYVEETLATAIGTGSSPTFITLNGPYQYLAVYYTVTGDDGPQSFHYNLTATDDCCGEADVALPIPGPG